MDWEPAPAEIDVWHAARVLHAHHGEDARFVASRRADELLRRGDLDGSEVWRRIAAKLRAWLTCGPLEGVRVQ